MNNDKENRGLWQGLKAKGYYIALILCACAIGISGYVYYRNTGSANTPQNEDTAPVTIPQGSAPVVSADGDLVPAIGPTPTDTTEDTTAPTETTGPMKTMWPLEGQTVAVYAMDKLAYNETTRDWRVHDGIDLSAAAGTDVKAAADGTVYTVYEDDLLGTTVVIRHEGGYVTTYGSLAETVSVSAGDTVSCGDVIGQVGTTALSEKALEPHVHFSVTCNGQGMDPAEFVQ